ncbi:MAG: hypothetical protein ACOC7J_06575, partial [Armatimonadota bacterium]
MIRIPLTCLTILAIIAAPRHLPAAEAPDTILLSACEEAADVGPARAPDEPSFDFVAWEATPFAGARVEGHSIRWHLRPSSAEQSSARLALA